MYRVEHSSAFSCENAQPPPDDLPEFHLRIEGDQAIVEPKQHFATAEEALKVVGPVLRAWELDAALTRDNPDVLRFAYRRALIEDRPPPQKPGVVQLAAGVVEVHSFAQASIRLSLSAYPAPPSGLTVKPGSEVEAMFDKWSRYKACQAELGNTADFCRGALEDAAPEQGARREEMLEARGVKVKAWDRQLTALQRAWNGACSDVRQEFLHWAKLRPAGPQHRRRQVAADHYGSIAR